jgi:hypothetical protein
VNANLARAFTSLKFLLSGLAKPQRLRRTIATNQPEEINHERRVGQQYTRIHFRGRDQFQNHGEIGGEALGRSQGRQLKR